MAVSELREWVLVPTLPLGTGAREGRRARRPAPDVTESCGRDGRPREYVDGMTEGSEPTTRGRHETRDEQLDRNWDDLLQELRVMQTGVQLLAGFLVTLPFQSAFAELDHYQRTLYLCVLSLAGLTTLMMLVPVAVHRRLFGDGVKEWLVATAQPVSQVLLGAVALLIAGVTSMVFDVVLGRVAGWVAGGAVLTAAVLLLAVLPTLVDRASRG
jgi:hypothetical protein